MWAGRYSVGAKCFSHKRLAPVKDAINTANAFLRRGKSPLAAPIECAHFPVGLIRIDGVRNSASFKLAQFVQFMVVGRLSIKVQANQPWVNASKARGDQKTIDN